MATAVTWTVRPGHPKLQYEMLNYLISLLHAVKKIVVKVLDCLLVGALCPVLRPCASLPAKVVTLWLPP